MAHRLLHSLVFSSVIALKASGCTTSHTPLVPPDPRDGGPPDDEDGGEALDASVWIPLADAGDDEEDAGAPRVDSGVRATDGGVPPADAGEPHDMRTCEPGWPTTKAIVCEPAGGGRMVCCRLPSLVDGGDDCCVVEEP